MELPAAFSQRIKSTPLTAKEALVAEYILNNFLSVCKRKIVEDSSGKSKAAIFRKWQPLSAYRLSRFPPWETSFWRIAMRKSFQQEV